jgi:hypothetical protein
MYPKVKPSNIKNSWIQYPKLLKHYAINEHQELIYEPLNRHDERFNNKPKWRFKNQKLGIWNLDFGTWNLTTHGNKKNLM